jgi:tetratricopeptide (TPR) repeat protein
MKSERRHELERNQLLAWLLNASEQVKPYLNKVLGGVAVLLLVILAFTLVNRYREGQASGAWDDYFASLSGADRTALENVAQKHPGTIAAHWALETLANLELESGCNLLFVNKTSANLELRKAVEHFQAVLNQARSPALLEQATYGLARAREAQGDIEQAQKAYSEIVVKWPQGTYAEVAKERVDDLKTQATRSFYDKFAKFDPKPALADEPGTPGKKPPFNLDSIPDKPDAAKKPEVKAEAPKAESKPAPKADQAKPENKPAAKK